MSERSVTSQQVGFVRRAKQSCGNPLTSPRLAPARNSWSRWQEKFTMCMSGVQIGNSGLEYYRLGGMPRMKPSCWILAVSIAILWPAGSPHAQTTEGAVVFEDHCASCHGNPSSATPATEVPSSGLHFGDVDRSTGHIRALFGDCRGAKESSTTTPKCKAPCDPRDHTQSRIKQDREFNTKRDALQMRSSAATKAN